MSKFYFRVVEGRAGLWLCRRGRTVIDCHDTREAAITHMTLLAGANRPSEVFVHSGDGNVEVAASFKE